jgi:hypothetical protein
MAKADEDPGWQLLTDFSEVESHRQHLTRILNYLLPNR